MLSEETEGSEKWRVRRNKEGDDRLTKLAILSRFTDVASFLATRSDLQLLLSAVGGQVDYTFKTDE